MQREQIREIRKEGPYHESVAKVGVARRGRSTSKAPSRATPWPRIESENCIMTVGSARPMEDAARIAYSELVKWLSTGYGFELFDAYQFLTQAGELYVGNMVDTTYSLVARCQKRYLS